MTMPLRYRTHSQTGEGHIIHCASNCSGKYPEHRGKHETNTSQIVTAAAAKGTQIIQTNVGNTHHTLLSYIVTVAAEEGTLGIDGNMGGTHHTLVQQLQQKVPKT